MHQSVPGVLGRLNAVFSSRGLNVHAQSLQTDGKVGYVLVDAESQPGQLGDILGALCDIEGTIQGAGRSGSDEVSGVQGPDGHS